MTNLKNSGITLNALIVTIIILLVLAGISIAMISGENGILNKAKIAKEESNAGEIEEQNRLGKYNESIDSYTTRSGSTGTTKTVLWEGSAQALGTYTFTNSSDDVINYDEVLIEYAQGNTGKHSIILEREFIDKTNFADIALWGYSTRFTAIHFIDHGFVMDQMIADSNCYNYIKRIVGIKL